jgi:hypothetical protein
MPGGEYVKDSKAYVSMAALVEDAGLRSGRSYGDVDHAECIVVK